MAIIGFELPNSTGNISPETWEGDGVLSEIFAHVTPEDLQDPGVHPSLIGVLMIAVEEGDQYE